MPKKISSNLLSLLPANQQGFSALFLVVIISAVIAGLGLVAWPQIRQNGVLGLSTTGALVGPYAELKVYAPLGTMGRSNFDEKSIFQVGQQARVGVNVVKPVGMTISKIQVFSKKMTLGARPAYCSETKSGWAKVHESIPQAGSNSASFLLDTSTIGPGSYVLMTKVIAKKADGTSVTCTGNPSGVCGTKDKGSCSNNAHAAIDVFEGPADEVRGTNIFAEVSRSSSPMVNGSTLDLLFNITNESSTIDYRNVKLVLKDLRNNIDSNNYSRLQLLKDATYNQNETLNNTEKWFCTHDICMLTVPYVGRNSVYKVHGIFGLSTQGTAHLEPSYGITTGDSYLGTGSDFQVFE